MLCDSALHLQLSASTTQCCQARRQIHQGNGKFEEKNHRPQDTQFFNSTAIHWAALQWGETRPQWQLDQGNHKVENLATSIIRRAAQCLCPIINPIMQRGGAWLHGAGPGVLQLGRPGLGRHQMDNTTVWSDCNEPACSGAGRGPSGSWTRVSASLRTWRRPWSEMPTHRSRYEMLQSQSCMMHHTFISDVDAHRWQLVVRHSSAARGCAAVAACPKLGERAARPACCLTSHTSQLYHQVLSWLPPEPDSHCNAVGRNMLMWVRSL